MADREERLEEEGVRPEPLPAPTAPPPPPGGTSRRARVRRALSSRPQLRDMVIVQEVLLPPVGLRDQRD